MSIMFPQTNVVETTFQEELFRFTHELRHLTKPMIIAANKSDRPDAGSNLKKLKQENKELHEKRDSIQLHLNSLNDSFNELRKQDSLLKVKISDQELEIQKFKTKANASKEQLNKLLKEMEETRNKIQELKNNPPNRTGQDLINSLKIKTIK